MSSRRPRRSRIYDLNYNIGENYYKSALDRLDEKNSRPASILLRRSEPPISPPRARFANLGDENLEEDLEFARDRASRAIQKETVFDVRSNRKALELESSFDGQVQRTLDRIQASKKLLNDLDNGYENNEAASSSVIKKRSLRVVSDVVSSSAANVSSNNELTKWTKLSAADDSESYARMRARQSAARLQDIEQDMLERSERQFHREQRAANVKKLLAESNEFNDDSALTNGVSSLKISKTTQKRITSY